MDPGPCPCLRPMCTSLHNVLAPIEPGPIPAPFPVRHNS